MTNLAAKSVNHVVEMGLCIGCGACMHVCPFDAINIQKNDNDGMYKVAVNGNCVECGLCVQVCFGAGVDRNLDVGIFGRDSEDPLLGTYLNCYAGYACDREIRYNSASGGIVTALLLFALEEKIVDGVLVTKMSENRPLEPSPFIAKTRREVVCASGSKYCPVPADAALEAIMREEGRFAVVGLPCHIYGIRKVESICPDLAKKIFFRIGLFCGGTQNFLATEYLLRKLKVRKGEITKIEYRKEGWPGKMLIELKTANNRKCKFLFPFFDYFYKGSSLFQLYRCTLCYDGFNKFSDIACGDAWLPKYQNDNFGTSIIMTRNEIGDRLIKGAYTKGRIQVEKIENANVKEAQKELIHKIHNLETRFQLLKSLSKSVPVYDIEVETPPPTFTNYTHQALLYLLMFLASKRYMWNLLDAYNALRQHLGHKR